MALIALKVINFLAFLAKHENNFDVPGVACGAPTTPNLLHSLAHHTTRFMRAAPYRGGQPRARKRKASIGKNRISAVTYLPTPLVGSGWCLVRKISPPLDMLAINDATDNAEQRAAIITKLADHMRRYGER